MTPPFADAYSSTDRPAYVKRTSPVSETYATLINAPHRVDAEVLNVTSQGGRVLR